MTSAADGHPMEGSLPERQALLALRRMRAKLDEFERAAREPIAIIGMGCRFPGGADDPEMFWDLLDTERDAITEVPPERWDIAALYDRDPDAPGKMYARWGGFLRDVDRFDPQFFGIAPREAPGMDPQQRLLLEVAWEALEHAGQRTDPLDGSPTGVFIGICNIDYIRLQVKLGSALCADAYTASGSAHSIASGRLSYLLGFQGPSVSIDTACSSSLVAVHLACQSLRQRECRMALAGGVNLILAPDWTINLCRAGMMSPTGRCRAFDAAADGFVRSEGCGVVVLKRLSDAMADGDRILALIRGTAVNQDGRSTGLTAPNELAQEAVVRAALAAGGVSPAEVGYIEAHGTGTILGDPIEAQALAAVLGEGREPDHPLLVGSVKTNIGHAETAAGMAGLIKVVLALQRETIPAHLHLKQLNPHISLGDMRLVIPTSRQPWPRGAVPRVAGVSSFGFSGTNAHVLVAEAPLPPPEPAIYQRAHHILCLSAKTQNALRSLSERYASRLSVVGDTFPDICFTANVGRSHFTHRAAIVADSANGAREGLAALSAGAEAPGLVQGHRTAGTQPKVAFLFTGQGAQYSGMGRQLYQTDPTFRAALERCAGLLQPFLDRPLLEVLFTEGPAVNQTGYTQPAIFALEYALAETWQSWGIRPVAVLGHSVGEYVAACVAGAISLKDACKLVATRAALMQALPGGGGMAAVTAPEGVVRETLESLADRVSIAAVNGPNHTVISGDEETVASLCARFETQGMSCRRLAVSHAFHSHRLEPMLDALAETARGIVAETPRIPLVSNLTGDYLERPPDGAYWRRHARCAVQFAASIRRLQEKEIDAFLEIGPHPVLLGMARQCVSDEATRWLPSLRKGRDDAAQMLDSLATLYIAGAAVDWAAFDRPYARRKVSLPTYPFEREPYWLVAASGESSRNHVGRDDPGPSGHPLLGTRLRSALVRHLIYERVLCGDKVPLLQDHRIYGRVVLPGAAYLEMALAAGADALGTEACVLEEVTVQEACVLPDNGARVLQLVLTPDGGGRARFEIFSRGEEEGATEAWRLHASGGIGKERRGADDGRFSATSPDAVRTKCRERVEPDVFYRNLEDRGVQFGPRFQGIVELSRRDGEALGLIDLGECPAGEFSRYRAHPGLLDSAFQTALAAWCGVAPRHRETGGTYVPVGLERCVVPEPLPPSFWSHAEIRSDPAATESFTADIRILDRDTWKVLAEIRGLTARRSDASNFTAGDGRPLAEWVYEMTWQPAPLEGSGAVPSDGPGTWLILSDQSGIGAALAGRLRRLGGACVLARPGATYASVGKDELTLDPTSPADFLAAWQYCSQQYAPSVRGIIHLWSVDARMGEGARIEEIDAAQRLGCRSFLSLINALPSGVGQPPRLLMVTRGAQAVADPDAIEPVQTAMWGLGRTVNAERPELRLTCVDLDASGDGAESLWAELLAPDDEPEVAYRATVRRASRLVRHTTPSGDLHAPAPSHVAAPMRLDVANRGTLENLELRSVTRRPPERGEVEIRVRATGLNFRDVLNVLGMYPGEAGALGSECAGHIVRVGERVDDRHVGEQVIALAEGCFSTYVTVRADRVVPKPSALSFEQAAAIPIAFMTAAYALRTLGGITAGDRVLIHAAAGGVGLAAVQLAQQAGAEIYATAGSEEKRAFLRGLGVPHVMSSRTVEFAAEVMRLTGDRGVDIVLNSLSGEFIPRSLSVLAPGGRFLEIGKTGVWDADRVAAVTTRVAYHIIYLGEVLDRQPALTRTMLAGLLAEFSDGRLTQVPRRVFPLEDAQSAFRFMAQAKHIGKIVITQGTADQTSARGLVAADASYLITGGLGAVGRWAAEWLVARGARHLVLMGRTAPGDEARETIRRMEANGARVLVVQGDVASEDDVADTLAEIRRSMPPLRGVLHAAGVLDDGVLAQQDWDRFRKVMAPKVLGGWILHRLTRDVDLDFFVLFSSVAALFGSQGQSNYAAANAFLDGLTYYRRSRDLCATGISWGAWAGAGMAAALTSQQWGRWHDQGMRTMIPDEGMRALEHLVRARIPHTTVLPLEWSAFERWCRANGTPRIWSLLVRDDPPEPGPSTRARVETMRIRLQGAPPDRRRSLLLAHVREQVLTVLGLPKSTVLDPHQGLRELGLDSLMTVELRNRLQKSMEQSLPSTLAFDYPHVAGLVEFLEGQLGQKAGPEPEPGGTPKTPDVQMVEQLSDEEAEALLLQELREPRGGGIRE